VRPVNALAGPFAIAATLLLVGGVLKARRPGDTAHALRALGLPSSIILVRAGGVLEALVGAVALAVGDRVTASLLALSYLGFALFVAQAMRRDAPISSCGCFGRVDTPPSRLHVVLNLAAAGVGTAVALQPGAGLPEVLHEQPLLGVPFLALVALGASLAFLSLGALPRLASAVAARANA
jgi:hypothetical protein